MFLFPRKTYDDTLVRKELKGRALSQGMFIEVHVNSLLDRELKLHGDFEINKGNILRKGDTIYSVKKVQEKIYRKVPPKYEEEEFWVNKVQFTCDSGDYIVSEGTFSMLLKRCLHTSKSTVCFSLRDEDKPPI